MGFEKTIKIKVDSKGAESNVDKLDNKIDRLDDSTNKTNKSFGTLKASIIAVAAALQVRVIARYADAFTSIQNQIRQTANSTKDLTQRTSELLGVANRSRVEFGATAELYTQLSLSTENLNLSTEQQLRLTETIAKSFAVSGKSAAESAGAIRQLGQAFSAGALRGDEFNSIAEGAPEIMRALQRSLKLTQGELRDFAATGGITAEVLVKALGGATEVIDGKMNKAVKTLSQSLQEAENNATAFIGSSDFIANAMTGAGDAVVYLSQNLGVIAAQAHRFNGIAQDLRYSIDELTSSFDDVDGASNIIGDAFISIPENIRTLIKVYTVETLAIYERAAIEAAHFKDNLVAIFTDSTLEESTKKRADAIKALNGVREDSLQSIFNERERAVSSIDAQIEKAKELRVELKKPLESVSFETISSGLAKTKKPKKESNLFVNTEIGKTDSLKAELEERRAIQIAYNNLALQDFQSLADEERAVAEFRRQEALIMLQREREDSAIDFTARNEALLANTQLSFEQKLELEIELQQQELTQKQLFEQQKTEIEQSFSEERGLIAKNEYMDKIQLAETWASATFSVVELFGSKSEKATKKRRVNEARMNGAAGIVRAWAESPFWLAVGQTIAIAASTEKQVSNIKSAGGGSGGGVSLPSSVQPPQRQEPIQQSQAVEIRGLAEVAEAINNLDPEEKISAEFTQRILGGFAEFDRIRGQSQ